MTGTEPRHLPEKRIAYAVRFFTVPEENQEGIRINISET